MDKRNYKRIATDVKVLFVEEQNDTLTRRYLEAMAENCDLGGMFIITDNILSKGTIIDVKFMLPSEEQYIEARAVVRWVRRMMKPHGLGIQFLEFSHMGELKLQNWYNRLFEQN